MSTPLTSPRGRNTSPVVGIGSGQSRPSHSLLVPQLQIYDVNDRAQDRQSLDSDNDVDDDDRRVLRELAATNGDSDDDHPSSGDERGDGKSEAAAASPATPRSGTSASSQSRIIGQSTSKTGNGLAASVGKSLSASSASVFGKITSGLGAMAIGVTAKRSPRVEPISATDDRIGEKRPESAAASTPRTPSPENFVWRPVMPGYRLDTTSQAAGGLQARTVLQQTVQVEQTQTSASGSGSKSQDDGLKQSIVIMPMPLALVCCILNFLSPGLGTLMSGLSLLCCSRPQMPDASRSNLILVNIWLALLQLITVVLFFAGWIWSIVWGLKFIEFSERYQNSVQANDDTEATDGGDTSRQGETTTKTTTTTTTMTTTTLSPPAPPDPGTTVIMPGEPPILILQEAPVIIQPGFYCASSAGYGYGYGEWEDVDGASGSRLPPVNRVRSGDSRGGSASDGGGRRLSVQSPVGGGPAPTLRRQRMAARRQTATQRAVDRLTGVLLRPETLEHIVHHSSVVPDPQYNAGSTSGGHGSGSIDVTHKPT